MVRMILPNIQIYELYRMVLVKTLLYFVLMTLLGSQSDQMSPSVIHMKKNEKHLPKFVKNDNLILFYKKARNQHV